MTDLYTDTPADLRTVQAALGALVRSPLRYSPKGKADGPLPASGLLDTGQAFTTFASPTSPAPLVLSGNRITHTPYAGVQSAGYMQMQAAGPITRAGCEVSWPAASIGIAAIVIPSAAWSSGVLPNAGFHFVTTGHGIWTLTRFTTGGSTTIATFQTHGRPATDARGAGLVPLDIWFDPPNNKAVIQWWDGSRSVITSSYIGGETADYAVFELFENDGATDTAASFGDLWVDDLPTRYDGNPSLPIFQKWSTAPAAYNALGTCNPDFTNSRVHLITMLGDITSMTFLNALPDAETFEMHLIQDGTGGRTLSGVSSYVRWAGGAAPTLTTTANRRDIFTFRTDAPNYFETSRSMNVGN